MKGKTSFSCGESVDIIKASDLKARLIKALEKSSVIELKANKVQKADTAGLQLFVALRRLADQKGGRLIWKSPSEALLLAAKQLGLTNQLGLD